MDDTRGDTAAEDGDVVGGEALPPTVVGFGLGLVVGMVLLGLVWLGFSYFTGTTTTPTARQGLGAAVDQHVSAPTRSAAPGPTRLELCRKADARVQPALRAAHPALSQWEVHVGAMNKLVVGAITLQQATDFWNQTRLAARHNLRVFRVADRRATGHAVRCVAPGKDHMSAMLRSCARRVAADRRTLSAARTATATWSHHVTDMDMLRMGKLAPATATRMWLASWKEGVRELQVYQDAVRATRSSGTC
jgi:hypothetical protein